MSDMSDDIVDLEINEETVFDENSTETNAPPPNENAEDTDETCKEDFSAEGYITEEQATKLEISTIIWEDEIAQQSAQLQSCNNSSTIEEQAEKVETDTRRYEQYIQEQTKDDENGADAIEKQADRIEANTIEGQSERLEENTRKFEKRVIARSREVAAKMREQSAKNTQAQSDDTDSCTNNEAPSVTETETETETETVTVSETDTVIEPDGTIETHTTTETQKIEDKTSSKAPTRKSTNTGATKKHSQKPSPTTKRKK